MFWRLCLTCTVLSLGLLTNAPIAWGIPSSQLPFSLILPATQTFAAAPDDEFAKGSATGTTIFVAKDGCKPTNQCSDINDGLSRETAVATIQHGLERMVHENQQGGGLLLIYQASIPYTETINIDMAHQGNSARPRFIQGVNASGQPPTTQAERPLVVPTGDVVFKFASQFWILDNVLIDCQNKSNTPGVHFFQANHIALKRSVVRNCQNSATFVSSSNNILIEHNILVDNRRPGNTADSDSNGFVINGRPEAGASHQVRILGNVARNNSGDGVQCQGPEQGDLVSTDIIIQDNTFSSDINLSSRSEEAVDIKSCEKVDIIGANDFSGFTQPPDVPNRSDCGGSAIVVHYAAKRVLIEGANIHDSGVGIALGRVDTAVEDIVIRRNRIHDITQAQKTWPDNQTTFTCGDGILLNRAKNADIHHNTLDKIPHSGIRVRFPKETPQQSGSNDNIHVWNNIMANVEGLAYFDPKTGQRRPDWAGGGTLDYEIGNVPGIWSNYNLFFNSKKPADAQLFRNAATAQKVTFQEWTGLSLDTVNSTVEDPKFISTSGSDAYFLASKPPDKSPALNTAHSDDGNGDRNQRCNGGPDKGAIESDCGAPATVTAEPSEATTTTVTAEPPETTTTAVTNKTPETGTTPIPLNPRTGYNSSSRLDSIALTIVMALFLLGAGAALMRHSDR